jgi:hypothetical protein
VRLSELFTAGRDGFDEMDRFLLTAIRDHAAGGTCEQGPYERDVFFRRAEQRRVTHLFFEALPPDDGTKGPSPFAAAKTYTRAILEENVRSWVQIAQTFASAGVGVAGFKGPFLNAVLGRPVARAPMSVDLDLIVRRDDLDRAVSLLGSLGYVKGLGVKEHRFFRLGEQWIRVLEAEQGSYGQIAPLARVLPLPELDQYADHLAGWFPRRGLVVTPAGVRSLTSLDLHFDLGHTNAGTNYPISADHLLNQTRTAEYLGQQLQTLDLATMTWLLSYRACLDTALYGERRFKLFADIAALVSHGGWSREAFGQATDRHPFIQGPVEATMDFIRTEIGIEVDSPAGDGWDPDTRKTPSAEANQIALVCHGWGTSVQTSAFVTELRAAAEPVGVTVEEFAPFGTVDDPTLVSEAARMLAERISELRANRPNQMIGVIGISLGSAAALAAVIAGAEANFVVSVGTCISDNISMSDNPEHLLEAGADDTTPGWSPFLTGHVGPEFLPDLRRNVPLGRLHVLSTPTLVLHGGRDNRWRRQDSEILSEHVMAMSNGSVYRCLPGGNHTLDNTPISATAEVLTWWKSIGVIGAAPVTWPTA